MQLFRLASVLALATTILVANPVCAKVNGDEANRLGTTLTPLGAIKAGNADGTIPAWGGGITTPPASYKAGGHHPDPYGDDAISFTITAATVNQHRDKLSPGQIAMFQRYPSSWKMNIYPTRRSASFPAAVYEASMANAKNAQLTPDGNGVTNTRVTSPFPIPVNGLQAIWNHLLRYRGESIERTIVQAVPTSGGAYNLIKIEEQILIPYNQQEKTAEEVGNHLAYFMQTVTEPAYLAGNILLVHDTINQNAEPRNAWVYNPGQRRVRRAPNIAFDNPGTASDGQRTTDQFDMYNGSPERYDWELVGRRELYVPYNSYKLHSDKVGYGDILHVGHMNPDLLRYELHRVWEVKATVRAQTSHIYATRVFFIDEDSWQIVLADQYDTRGNIWRLSEGHAINYYEVPLYFDTVQAHYDLLNGRYLVLGMNNREQVERFKVPFKASEFTPERLRRQGRR